jgi:hypothetical protein
LPRPPSVASDDVLRVVAGGRNGAPSTSSAPGCRTSADPGRDRPNRRGLPSALRAPEGTRPDRRPLHFTTRTAARGGSSGWRDRRWRRLSVPPNALAVRLARLREHLDRAAARPDGRLEGDRHPVNEGSDGQVRRVRSPSFPARLRVLVGRIRHGSTRATPRCPSTSGNEGQARPRYLATAVVSPS